MTILRIFAFAGKDSVSFLPQGAIQLESDPGSAQRMISTLETATASTVPRKGVASEMDDSATGVAFARLLMSQQKTVDPVRPRTAEDTHGETTGEDGRSETETLEQDVGALPDPGVGTDGAKGQGVPIPSQDMSATGTSDAATAPVRQAVADPSSQLRDVTRDGDRGLARPKAATGQAPWTPTGTGKGVPLNGVGRVTDTDGMLSTPGPRPRTEADPGDRQSPRIPTADVSPTGRNASGRAGRSDASRAGIGTVASGAAKDEHSVSKDVGASGVGAGRSTATATEARYAPKGTIARADDGTGVPSGPSDPSRTGVDRPLSLSAAKVDTEFTPGRDGRRDSAPGAFPALATKDGAEPDAVRQAMDDPARNTKVGPREQTRRDGEPAPGAFDPATAREPAGPIDAMARTTSGIVPADGPVMLSEVDGIRSDFGGRSVDAPQTVGPGSLGASGAEAARTEVPRTAWLTAPGVIERQIAGIARLQGPGRSEVVLDPRELGRVRMTMTAESGAMHVALTAERPETLDLMRRCADALAEEFRDQGFGEVTFTFDEGKPDTDAPPGNDDGTADNDGGAHRTTVPSPPWQRVEVQADADGRLDIRI